MIEDPPQTSQLLLARIIEHLSAQQGHLCDKLRTARSDASARIPTEVSGWRLSTAPAPPIAFCIPTRRVEQPPSRLVERPLRHPTKRNYDYFVDLDRKLAELVTEAG